MFHLSAQCKPSSSPQDKGESDLIEKANDSLDYLDQQGWNHCWWLPPLCETTLTRGPSVGGGWSHGVETVASIVVRVSVRVRVYDGSGGLKNTRITERTQQFILVQADRCPTSSS
jgi:hypothetical protein